MEHQKEASILVPKNKLLGESKEDIGAQKLESTNCGIIAAVEIMTVCQHDSSRRRESSYSKLVMQKIISYI